MSAAMKFSLLALLGSAAAHPSYGAHSKYHAKPAGAKPYPVGGWSGNYNSTRVAYPTATGLSVDEKTTTIDSTTTSTTTLFTTIYGTPEAVTSVGVKDVPTGAAGCGPATVTVTASEKVTVTVTPGGGANVPTSSATPVASSAGGDYDYPAPSPPVVEQHVSSKAEGYPVNTPTPVITSAYEAPASSAAPSSAAFTSSAAPKPSGSPSYTGSKRGLAFNSPDLCKTFASKFGFSYNWGQKSSDVGAPFVPMMHKPSDSSADEWLANVDEAVKGGSKAVMGFNEPDHTAQANLTPDAACSAWKEYMNPIAESHSDVTIIGPGVTNGPAGSGMGLEWLSKFHEVCPDAVVHATNIHFYDIYDEGTVDRFRAHVEKAAEEYGKPVWVTEFGLNPGATQDQAASFLKDCMSYLDGSDKVQGYSYFMVGTGENQLNTADGLSALGEIYAASN